MKRLNKTTYRMEQSLEAYSCSCSCTVTNNCPCSCGNDMQLWGEAKISGARSNESSDRNSVDSSARSNVVNNPFIICSF